jgi:hypothetical protein
MERKKCCVEGCNSLGRNKGISRTGKTIYDRYCDKHHRLRSKNPWGRIGIPNNKCSICGWDKAPCDRHRINKEIGYIKENIRVLCPNCHRLQSLGQLK